MHHARLAWDAARLFVAVADGAEDRRYDWLASRLDLLFGPEYQDALSISRTRLMYRMRADADSVEAGMWRARLHEMLDHRPQLAAPLATLIAELTPAPHT